VKTGTTESPKFKNLKTKLGLPTYAVVGVLESVWQFAKKNSPQGNIGKWTNAEIEGGIEWNGPPGTLIDALVETKWIDRCEVHRLILHDWLEHLDGWLKNSLKAKGLKVYSANTVESTNTHGVAVVLPGGDPVTPNRQDKPNQTKTSLDKTRQATPSDGASRLTPFSRDNLFEVLVSLSVDEREARELTDEFEPEEIQRQIEWLPLRGNGKPIKNPAGLLIKAIRERFSEPTKAKELP